MPGASRSPVPKQQQPDGRERDGICSKRETDSWHLTGKEGGLAIVSRHLIADGLMSASVTGGAYSQKIT